MPELEGLGKIGGLIGAVIGVLVLILVFGALYPSIQDGITDAQNVSTFSSVDSLLSIWPLLVVLVVMLPLVGLAIKEFI